MKKNLFGMVMTLFVAFAIPVTFVSCGDDDDEIIKPGGGGNDNEKPGVSDEVLSEEKQKECLESVALDLMNKVNAEDFRVISTLVKDVEDQTESGEVFDTWLDEALELCEISANEEVVKNLYKLSNFHGEFTLQDGTWEQNAKDVKFLKFNFTSNTGESCYLKISHSEKGTTIHNESFDYEDWSGWDEYLYYENSFMIPEKINVELVQGSKVLSDIVLETTLDLPDGSGTEFDYIRDAASIKATFNVADYSILLEKAEYKNGKYAGFAAKFQKNNETLMSMNVSGEGDITNEENLYGSISNVSYKIMDKLEFKGSVLDINKLEKYLDEMWDNEEVYTNEENFKKYLDEANKLIDIQLYFNGSSKSSSYLELYPFFEEDYYYEGYWDYESVIMFSDGTGYASFENYFDEIFFDNVIKKFENLVSDFEGLAEDGKGKQ